MDFGPEVMEYQDKKVGVYGGKFYPFHRGHLSFILKAQSMVDVLFVAVQYDEEYERGLVEGTDFEYVDGATRERWITETFRDFPNIRVLSQYEHRSDDHMNDDSIYDTYNELRTLVGGHIDVLFSNTHEYDEYFAKYVPEAEHIVFYEDRPIVNISATEIRNDGVYAHWDALPDAVRRHYQKRVAIVGIESSGKTHLSKMLAASMDTVAVSEWGRLFYERLGGYTGIESKQDFIDIASGHVHLLNEAARATTAPVVVSDTDMVYTQFFYEQSFGERSSVLEALILAGADRIDTRIFIEPYEAHELDGTRLDADAELRAKNRAALLALYKDYEIPYVVVDEPDRVERFERVAAIADGLISGVQSHA